MDADFKEINPRYKQPESWPALPPLWPPLLYLVFATLSFALALAAAIGYAQDFTGFYYHPRLLALTHLVTLGWITGNILGNLYLVAPISLHLSLPARKADHFVFALYAIGVLGMASHFWISHDAGLAWSAGCVYLALLLMTIKTLRLIRQSKAPGFVKFHIVLSFSNILVAGGWGLIVAINKTYGFLPTAPSANILAHAHMAAIGWAMMLVFGISYRLLPMFIPGEPVKGRLPWASAILIESGVLGLFVSLLTGSRWSLAPALVICAGVSVFLMLSVQTARRRKRAPPPEPPRPDFGMLHALFSFLCLLASAAAGIALTTMPSTPAASQLALAYGFVGLVGFQGQMVTGMKPKILSILAWYYAFTRLGATAIIPRPVDMPIRHLQIFTFALWLLGIPLFVTGILRQSVALITAGAVSLFTALVVSTVHEIMIARLIFKKCGSDR